MFSKLFGSSKKTPAQPADLSLGYERLDEFKNYLAAQQYEAFEAAYKALQWDAQTLLNEGIGLDKDSAPAIASWVQQQPDSYVANLFAGVSHTGLAWTARTAAMAKDVSEENANKYFELLETASQYLSRADELNPDDAEICARTIRVYMGMGVEEETVLGYFNAGASIVPGHLMLHLMLINYLNPKWQGSVEAMHDFAEQRMAEGGNSLLVTLKLFAITEEWLYYSMNGEEKKHRRFFEAPEIKETVQSLYAGYTEAEEGRLLVPYVYNYFAFLFWQTGNKATARELIKKIPGKMTVYPWAYINIDNNDQLQQL